MFRSLQAPSRYFLPASALKDPNYRVAWNHLCTKCVHLCSESQVLNNAEWHVDESAISDLIERQERHGVQSPGSSKDGWGEGYFAESYLHHSSFEDLLSSALEGCHLCCLFCYGVADGTHARMMGWKFPPETLREELHSALWRGLRNKEKIMGPLRVSLTYECDYSGEITRWRFVLQDDCLEHNSAHEYCRIALRSLSQIEDIEQAQIARSGISTGSAHSFVLARIWLDECLRSHPNCTKSTKIGGGRPARLIDVQCQNGSESVQLHLCTDACVRHSYLTLSHCWGKSEMYKLTSDTIQEICQGIAERLLPLNFQHAIKVCRGLGQRYIWIDSLCIKQDSRQDWQEQSAIMGSIYAQSVCTIAAFCARDSSEGFLRTRNPLCQKPCKLPSAVDMVALPYRNDDDDTAGPLETRGWVLQERILSPRTLLFHETKVAWECQETLLNEDFPCTRGATHNYTGIDQAKRSFSAVKLRDSLTDLYNWGEWNASSSAGNSKFLTMWHTVVKAYTGLTLTYESDRAVAFSGIVQLVQEHTGFACFEALWLEDCIGSLLWYVHRYGGRRLGATSTRDAQTFRYGCRYNANSLSWVSVSGQIDYEKLLPTHERRPQELSAEFKCISDATLPRLPESGCVTLEADQCDIAYLEQQAKGWSDQGGRGFRAAALNADNELQYCATYIRSFHKTSTNQVSCIILEGPLNEFRSTKQAKNWWTSPYPKDDEYRGFIFIPDLYWLHHCPVGTTMDIACLHVARFTWSHRTTSYGTRADGSYGEIDLPEYKREIWEDQGIVLAKPQGLTIDEGALSQPVCTRIGFFRIAWEPRDFPFGKNAPQLLPTDLPPTRQVCIV